MFAWIKRLVKIVAGYDAQVESLQQQLRVLQKLLKERTEVSASISHGGNYAILVGKYKGVDYVETVKLSGNDFNGVVTQLKDISRHANIQQIDCPPQMRFVVDLAKNQEWKF